MFGYFWDRHFWVGFPPEMLIRNAELIRVFVEQNRLAPLHDSPEGKALGPMAMAGRGRRGAMAGQEVEARDARLEELVINPRDLRGGIRIDHLHFDGSVYLLTHDQWQAFSGHMLKTYADRLAQAQQVSFDELVDVGGAVDSLPASRA